MSNMDPDSTREAWGWVMQAMPMVDELTPDVRAQDAELPVGVVCVEGEAETLQRSGQRGGRSVLGPEGTRVFVVPHARFCAEFPAEGVAAKLALVSGKQLVAVQGSTTMLLAQVPLDLEERRELFTSHGWR